MQPLAQLSRLLDDAAAMDDIVLALDKKYVFTALPVKTTQMTFFDTFDWRLYARNTLCYIEDNAIHLVDFNDNIKKQPLMIKGRPPRNWKELPDCDIKEYLLPTIEMRTLLAQTACTKSTEQLNILNRDKKIVAIVTFTEMQTSENQSYRTLHLREVRGYSKWFFKLSRELEKFGTPRPDTLQQTLINTLASCGRKPLEYSSSLSISLQKKMSASTAVRSIYKNLLDTMLANADGIIQDIDTEFLHDFRVAIRRTRSGLALIKNVIDPEIATRFKEDFRYLGQITGPVRDLDVYLLSEENYKARLPEYLQEGLQFFFENLASQRRQEQKKLVRALKSSRYQTIINDWQQYLTDESETSESKQSQTEVGRLANTIIFKRFKRVLRDGRAITAKSPDQDLHRLRIQGKKLRYVLEFFNSLYPQKEMRYLIKQLKLLQNNLGDFNDLSVQQDMLKYTLSVLKPGTVKTRTTSASLGGLLTNLYHEHQRVRSRFDESFARFSESENLALYRRLFK